MVLDLLPELTNDWAKQPSARRSYPESVERWRADVAKLMPEALKQRPDAERLVDKALHVINGESGGNPSAVGDGGIANGLFQSHYVGKGASPEQQIADAWRLILPNPNQWTDWGEGVTYQGKVFGALGNVPYDSTPGGPGPGSGGALAPVVPGQRLPVEEQGLRGDVARILVQKRLDVETARRATVDEERRATLETQLGAPLSALPHEEEARYSHGPDPVYPHDVRSQARLGSSRITPPSDADWGSTQGAPVRAGIAGMGDRARDYLEGRDLPPNAIPGKAMEEPFTGLPAGAQASLDTSQIRPPSVGDEGLAPPSTVAGAVGGMFGRAPGAAETAYTDELARLREEEARQIAGSSASGGSGFAPGVVSGMGGGGNAFPGTMPADLSLKDKLLGSAGLAIRGAYQAAGPLEDVPAINALPGGAFLDTTRRGLGAAGLNLPSGPTVGTAWGTDIPYAKAVREAVSTVPSAHLLRRTGVERRLGLDLPSAGDVLSMGVPVTLGGLATNVIGAKGPIEAFTSIPGLDSIRIGASATKASAKASLERMASAAARSQGTEMVGTVAAARGGVDRARLGANAREARYGALVRDGVQQAKGPEAAARIELGLVKTSKTWADYGDAVEALAPETAPWLQEPASAAVSQGSKALRQDGTVDFDVLRKELRQSVEAVSAERAGQGAREQASAAARRVRPEVGGEGSMLGRDARQLRTGEQNPVQPEDIAFGEQQTAESAGMREAPAGPGARESMQDYVSRLESMDSKQLRQESNRVRNAAGVGDPAMRAAAVEKLDSFESLMERRQSGNYSPSAPPERPRTSWRVTPAEGEPYTAETLAGARSGSVEEAQATFANEAQRARDLGDQAKSARRAGIAQQAQQGIRRLRDAIVGEPELPGAAATGRRALARTGEEAAGAPPGIVTPEHYNALIDRLTESAKANEADRFWYEAGSKAINDVARGNPQDAELMARLFAVGSVQTNVRDQAMYTLRNWANIKAGQPLTASHRFPNQVGQMLDDAVNMSQAEWDAKIIDNIKAGRSEKLNNFYLDYLDGIDPERAAKLREASGATVTVDQWMNRAFGYAADSRTPAQYRFMAEATKRVAERLGWTPKQAQAAIWIHEIIDAGQASADEAAVTIADSLARHKTQLFNEVVPAPGSPRFAVVGEALPNARPEQLAEHAKLVDSAMRDEDGYDLIAKAVDLPVEPVHGNPLVGPAPGGEGIGAVGPEQLPKLQIYAEARAMALGQAEGSWLRRFTIKSAGQHNAQWLDIGRTATHDELEALRNALPDLVVKPTDEGAAVFRVPDEADYASRAANKADAAVSKLNKDNQRLVVDAANGIWENTEVSPKIQSFAADGGRVALNGEGSALGAALDGSPALREAVDRVRQRVAVADRALAADVAAPERGALPDAGSLFTRTGNELPGPSAVPAQPTGAGRAAPTGGQPAGAQGFFGTEGIPSFADPLNPTPQELDAVRTALLTEANRLDQTGVSSPMRSWIGDAATLAKRLGDPGSEIRRQLQQNGLMPSIVGGDQEGGGPRQPSLGDLANQAPESLMARRAAARDLAKESQKPGKSKLWANVTGAFGAPRALALSADTGVARDLTILASSRKGLGAAASGARANIQAYWSPVEAAKAQSWVTEHPIHDFVTSTKNFDRPFHVYSYGGGVPSDLRVPEMSSLNESRVSRTIGGLSWVERSDRALSVGRNVAGMELLSKRYDELAQIYGTESMRFYSEMQSTIDWVNNIRGYSGSALSKNLGALNFLTSPQQMVSRLQLAIDPIVFAKRGDLNSARFAAENLLGFAASQASYLTLLKIAERGNGGAWSVNMNPTSSDFGQVKVGNTRFDTLAGLGPIIKLLGRAGAATSDSLLGTELAPDDQAELGTLLMRWFENKENPSAALVTDYVFHNKLPSEEDLLGLVVPSLVMGINDVYQNESGTTQKALYPGVAGAQFLGVGTTTYKSGQDVARETAQGMGFKDYQGLETAKKLQVLDKAPPEARKGAGNPYSEARKSYEAAIKQAGYVEPEKAPTDKVESTAEEKARARRNKPVNEKNAEIIAKDPELEVQKWFFTKTHGGELDNRDSVSGALALNLADREVKFAGHSRNLAASEDDRKFWQDYGKVLDTIENGVVSDKGNLDAAAQFKFKKNYDQLDETEKDTAVSYIRSSVKKDAKTEALMIFSGKEGPNADGEYTASSAAVTTELQKLWKDYPEAAKLPLAENSKGKKTSLVQKGR